MPTTPALLEFEDAPEEASGRPPHSLVSEEHALPPTAGTRAFRSRRLGPI